MESLTVDTKEQYDDVAGLFERLQRDKPDFGFYDLIESVTESGTTI